MTEPKPAMDILTFVVEMTKALAWPLSAGSIIGLLHDPIGKAISRVNSIKIDKNEVTFRDELPEDLGRKLRHDAELGQPNGEPTPALAVAWPLQETSSTDETGTSGVGPSQAAETNHANAFSKSERIRGAFMAESLVFIDLQTIFRGSVKREVIIDAPDGTLRVDGVIYTDSGIIVVEVLHVPSTGDKQQYSRALSKKYWRLSQFFGNKRFKVVIAVVFDKIPDDVDDFVGGLDRSRVDIRFYELDKLLSKYGLESVPVLGEMSSAGPQPMPAN